MKSVRYILGLLVMSMAVGCTAGSPESERETDPFCGGAAEECLGSAASALRLCDDKQASFESNCAALGGSFQGCSTQQLSSTTASMSCGCSATGTSSTTCGQYIV